MLSCSWFPRRYEVSSASSDSMASGLRVGYKTTEDAKFVGFHVRWRVLPHVMERAHHFPQNSLPHPSCSPAVETWNLAFNRHSIYFKLHIALQLAYLQLPWLINPEEQPSGDNSGSYSYGKTPDGKGAKRTSNGIWHEI
ncbi:hypothetical protein BC938DRAFT_476364 [Jimgerdemannia flammicorona]|uniref:Uncharacterized protein n=1 Tax=Jimgerdemannia flammicorona TaxID=994334 RepID=A0A433QQM4_9FUNG|nr:hypothetical protein BC938DRAFT_476364 [Jimgerdemannia flammicorona]